MFDYKIVAHEENGHFWSSCPDIPEAHSAGDTLEELLENAVEGITLAMSIYVERRQPIPYSTDRGDHHVRLPGVTVAKALLWNMLVKTNKTRADLAEMLSISPVAAGRLVDFEHSSKLESIENALALFGLRLQITGVESYAVGTPKIVYPGMEP
ncbi:transcriptional regulator [Pseudomonas alkylphenolica]|uniref:Transcriptional regulator n=1 Tax=Pseudomonas alkylphenolica TaxID=237609 RepID=A0A443ZQA7_9PSED|nr:type II toxin-antitoxin system HicB family antitoxin [Pseudomonas alkylphenolica]RWU21299.1 transcriptional regulator [Pseudomonas alkylphenolica]